MYKTLFVKSFVENIFEWRMLCCIEQGSRCEQEEEVKGMEKKVLSTEVRKQMGKQDEAILHLTRGILVYTSK